MTDPTMMPPTSARPRARGRALAALSLAFVALAQYGCEDTGTDAAAKPPGVTIHSPAADASFPIGTSIRFSGTAVDAEGHTLAGPALAWDSDLDGAMGKGWWIEKGNLKAGRHKVTLKATDAAGATLSSSITVVIIGTGTIDVTVRTTGTNLDPDGYTVSAGSISAPLGVNGAASLREVSPGARAVTLSGLAQNCRVTGANPVTVTVVAAGTVTVSFAVSCEALFGSLRVTAVTTGDSPDPDGYTVTVDGRSTAVATNGSVVVLDVAPGARSVLLGGLDARCTVTGSNPATVTVAGGQQAQLTFNVRCTAGGGAVRVTTVTTGSNLDPDGYLLTLAGRNNPLPVNGETIFTGLTPGTQIATLFDLAGNCTTSSRNPVSINVVEGQTSDVSFVVNCVALAAPKFASDILPIFNNAANRAGGGPACTGCHFAGSGTGGLDLAGPNAYAGVRARVIPGNINLGRLMCRITQGTRPGCTQSLPDHNPANPMGLIPSAIGAIDAWINGGMQP
jgi:hypothetical protein